MLNALRHQRMVQWLILTSVSLVTSAQRLTASEDGAAGKFGILRSIYRVCSTPYGIRGWCRLP